MGQSTFRISPLFPLKYPPQQLKACANAELAAFAGLFPPLSPCPLTRKFLLFPSQAHSDPPFHRKSLRVCLMRESLCVTWAGTDLGVVVVWGSPKRAWGQVFLSARLKEAKISGNSPFAPKRKKKKSTASHNGSHFGLVTPPCFSRAAGAIEAVVL